MPAKPDPKPSDSKRSKPRSSDATQPASRFKGAVSTCRSVRRWLGRPSNNSLAVTALILAFLFPLVSFVLSGEDAHGSWLDAFQQGLDEYVAAQYQQAEASFRKSGRIAEAEGLEEERLESDLFLVYSFIAADKTDSADVRLELLSSQAGTFDLAFRSRVEIARAAVEFSRGEYVQASQRVERIIEPLRHDTGDYRINVDLANAHILQSRTATLGGDFIGAILHAAPALRVSDSPLTSDRFGSRVRLQMLAKTRALLAFGLSCSRAGDLQRGQSSFQEARKLGEQLGNRREVAAALIGIGDIQFVKGEYDSARASYEWGKQEFRAVGDEFSAAICACGEAEVLLQLGYPKLAIAKVAEGGALFQRKNHLAGFGVTNLLSGRIHMAMTELQVAETELETAYEAFTKARLPVWAARTQAAIAEVTWRQGDIDGALMAFSEAEQVLEAHRSLTDLAEISLHKGALVRSQRPGEGRRAFQTAAMCFAVLGLPERERHALQEAGAE